MASLREDKKLAKFFMTDKQPSKRLKSAFKFCSTSTPSNITFFFREKASAVLEVLNETIDEYHTSSDAGEGASEKSSGFFSRFKRDKTAVTADKVSMVFEVFRVLIRESRDKIRNLWERRTIEDMLNKLVHRRHDFASRTRALKLVLEFIDAAYDVEDDAVYHSSAPLLPLKHSQLLLRAVDLSVLMRANRDSVGDVAYTAMLPAMPACSPHSVLLSTTPATPDHTLKLLQEVLRHTVRKGTSTTRFGFWFRVVQEVFLRMVYVDVFSRLGAARDSASAPAGGAGGAGAGTTGEYGFKPRCPPALQCVLTQWLLNIIQQQPQFLEGLFDSPATVEVVMEVFRQSLMEPAIAGQTIHAYLHWVDGTLTRPRCMSDARGLRSFLFIFIEHVRQMCSRPRPSRWTAVATLAGSTAAALAAAKGTPRDQQRRKSTDAATAGAAASADGAADEPVVWARDEAQTVGVLWRQHMQWCLELIRNISVAGAAQSSEDSSLRVGASAADTDVSPSNAAPALGNMVGIQLRAALLDIAAAHVKAGVCDEVVTAAIFRRVLGAWLDARSVEVFSAAHWAPLYGGVRQWLSVDVANTSGVTKTLLSVWRSQLLLQFENVLKTLGISSRTSPPGAAEEAFTVAMRTLRVVTPATLATLDVSMHNQVIHAVEDAVGEWLQALRIPHYLKSPGASDTATRALAAPLVHIAPDSILDLFGPWVYCVADDTRRSYASSRAVALRILAKVMTLQSAHSLSPRHLPRLVSFLMRALQSPNNAHAVQLALVTHCATLCASDISGATAMVPSLLGAADRLLRLASSGDQGDAPGRVAAIRLVGTLVPLANHYPSMLLPAGGKGADVGMPVVDDAAVPEAAAKAAAAAGLDGRFVRCRYLQPAIVGLLRRSITSAKSAINLRVHCLWSLVCVIVDSLCCGSTSGSGSGGDSSGSAAGGAGSGAGAGFGSGAGAGSGSQTPTTRRASLSVTAMAWEPESAECIKSCLSTLVDTSTRSTKALLSTAAFQALGSLAPFKAQLVHKAGEGVVVGAMDAICRSVEAQMAVIVTAAEKWVNPSGKDGAIPAALLTPDPGVVRATTRASAALACLRRWLFEKPCLIHTRPDLARAVFLALEAALVSELRHEDWSKDVVQAVRLAGSLGDGEAMPDEATRAARLRKGAKLFTQLRRYEGYNSSKLAQLIDQVGVAALDLTQQVMHFFNAWPRHPQDRPQGGPLCFSRGDGAWPPPAVVAATSSPGTPSHDALATLATRHAHRPSRDSLSGAAGATLRFVVMDSFIVSVHASSSFADSADATTGGARVVVRDVSGVFTWDLEPAAHLHGLSARLALEPPPDSPAEACGIIKQTRLEAADADNEAKLEAVAVSVPPQASAPGRVLPTDASPKLPSLGVAVLSSCVSYVHAAFQDCPERPDDPTLLGGTAALVTETRGTAPRGDHGNGGSGDDASGTSQAPAHAVGGTAVDSSTGRVKPLVTGSKVERILMDPRSNDALLAFMKTEHAEESLLFWRAVQEYKAIADSADRKAKALEIVAKFVDDASMMQVNLDASQFAHIHARVADEDFAADLFDEGEEELVTKVIERDTLPRFFRFIASKKGQTADMPQSLRLHDDLVALRKQVEQHAKHEREFASRPEHALFAKHEPLAITTIDPKLVGSLNACRLVLSQLGLVLPDMSDKLRYLPNTREVDIQLRALDRVPYREVISAAVLFVKPHQRSAAAVLQNADPPPEFGRLLDALGWKASFPLSGDALTAEHGADSDNSSGEDDAGSPSAPQTCQLPYFADTRSEVIFHAMPVLAACGGAMKLERLLLKSSIHVVWSDTPTAYEPSAYTVRGQTAAVAIVIYPMRRAHKRLYRIKVHSMTPGLALFGPLWGDMLVAEPALASLVRETVINADHALREHRSGVAKLTSAQRRRNALVTLATTLSRELSPLDHLKCLFAN